MHPPVLIIPAFNPDKELITLLTNHRVLFREQTCIVINDGSLPECETLFKTLEQQKITVLHHPVNAGKGEALKTGMRYFLDHFIDISPGVITADADGQHSLEDIIKISKTMMNHPNQLHLGIRHTSTRSAPLRSRIGNGLTRLLFNRFTQNDVKDTQTGLRGVPVHLIQRMIASKSSGYEFEFEMFFIAKQLGTTITQTPIKTIYINNNESSHFNPWLDSLKIYYIFIRFCGVSIVSFLIDFVLFFLLFYLFHRIGIAMLMARIVSASVNFLLNKNLTFRAQQHILIAALKFTVLALFIGISSFQLLKLISQTGLNIYLSKIVAEFLLFLASFIVQYGLIFSKKQWRSRWTTQSLPSGES